MEILRTENLTRIFGEGDLKVVAVDNVNLLIERGELISIVGASGSGESTSLYTLINKINDDSLNIVTV